MPKIKSTHVVLEYGKPIYVKELSKEDQKHLGTYTQNIIYEMLEKNKSLVYKRYHKYRNIGNDLQRISPLSVFMIPYVFYVCILIIFKG